MKKTGFILTLLLQAGLLFAQPKLLKETPGVVSYTFREDFAKDVPGTLDTIKKMGITNIEFSSLFSQSPEALRAMLDNRGMRCTSLGVGYADLQKDPDAVIKTAKILGAKYVRVASIPHPGDFQDLTAYAVKQATVDFNIFGKKLADAGLTFCYHNHGPEFKDGKELGYPTFFDYLVQKTDPEYVSFEMDVLWVYWPGQDPVKLLQKYPERFKLMHVKNVKQDIPRGGPSTNVSVGEGQIDMAAVLRAAQHTAIKYYFIEDESPAALIHGQVPVSIRFMENLTR